MWMTQSFLHPYPQI
uniref:Uncharacterized protein n=1 Tax=Anguilla anguilla TaxID=7936 RepID=A0A0E9P9D6_ANGAN